MPVHSLTRRVGALASLLLLGLILPAAAGTAAFPPLNQPATKESHPGRFVWADLFTTDPAAATKFYCALLGWTATTIDLQGKAYTVFRNGPHPVAGLAPRPPSNTPRPSRWVGYIAVPDIKAALAAVEKVCGQVRAPARDFPDRGAQAIIADCEGSTVGLLQSTTGDPPEGEPEHGDWNWFQLFVHNPQGVAAFYRDIIHYAVKPDLRTGRKNDFILSSEEHARAGVAPLPDRDDSKPGWIGIIRVRNLAATLLGVEQLGGKVLLAPRAGTTDVRFAIIGDPTGGAIGLVEYADNDNPANIP